MILFSSFNQALTFWLFCYLGFLSSVVFFTTFWLGNFFAKTSFFSIIFQKMAKKMQKKTKNKLKNSNLENLRSTNNIKNTDGLSLKQIFKLRKKAEKEKNKKAKLALKKEIKKKKSKMSQNSNKNNQKKQKKYQKRKLSIEKKLKRRKKLIKIAMQVSKKVLFVAKIVKKYLFVGVLVFILAVCLIKMLKVNLDLNFGEITFFNIFAYFVSFCAGKTFLKMFAKILARIYNTFRRRKNEKVNR